MVIKASAATEIRQLIAALGGNDDVRREAAIARLAIIGGRAVDRLVAAYEQEAARDTRIAILRALESTGDTRVTSVARAAVAEGGDMAVAAAGVLRGLLESAHPQTATEALDTLVATAIDPSVEHRVRLAAFEALQEVPGGVRERVAAALECDADPSIQAAAAGAPHEAAAADALWQDALEGRLPDHAGALREVIQARAPSAAPATLQKLVDELRAREGAVHGTVAKAEWRGARGALHQVLALRGSRLALYDLRESLEGARAPLPVSFLAALHVIGDESCLDALAAAHAGAADARWKGQLADAFRAIARREKISRRHAAMKRAAAKWPASVAAILDQ